ncbi:MAG: hypothetical protein F4Y51_02675 [Cenarchaeum sp. SB0664_bin_35]|nr:hypothetical protein [Cenarchaeum sp. SB0664_bin_35]
MCLGTFRFSHLVYQKLLIILIGDRFTDLKAPYVAFIMMGAGMIFGIAEATDIPEAPHMLDVLTAGTLVDDIYIGSDTTPTISVMLSEPDGEVILYSDPQCLTPLSAPAAVNDAITPYQVEVKTHQLAEGPHTIHARHTKSLQSECSAASVMYHVIPPMAATYRVTFTGAFTTDALAPGVGVPGGAHFTTLVGGIHNSGITFWERGGIASAGTEQMAETGRTGDMRAEVAAAMPDATTVLVQGIPSGGTPSGVFEVMITGEHASVTLASMVAPSPDWFVGTSGLPLLESDGTWSHYKNVHLYPYDAGTENGEEFSLSNEATIPHRPITSLRDSGKFAGEPIATILFERLSLVSNLGQTGSGALFVGHSPDAAAQGFRTGAADGGYRLQSVTAMFGDSAGVPGDLEVSIMTTDGNMPGMVLGTLEGANPHAAGLHTFTHKDGIHLEANTNYYVVFDVPEYVPASAYRLLFTDSDIVDSGTTPGWSIADELLGDIHDTHKDGSWKISVHGVITE